MKQNPPTHMTVIPAAGLRPTPVDYGPTRSELRSLGLTPRQAEVLELAVRGLNSPQIAALLSLSRRTVEKHFEGIYAQLGAANRVQAIVGALRLARPT